MRRFLVLMMALLAAAGCGRDTPSPAQPPAVRVSLVGYGATSGPGQRYTGSVMPYIQVQMAFKNGGYIDEVMQVPHSVGPSFEVQQGDYVRRGDVLAVIRTNDYETKVSQAQAGVQTGQAQAVQAEAAVQQAQAGLVQAQAGVKQAHDALQQARAQVTSAEAGLRAAQAGVLNAKANQTDATNNYQRANALFAAAALTKTSYDSAVQAYQSANAGVQSAQAQVTQAQAALEQARASLSSAESKITTAQAQVELQRAQLSQAKASAMAAEAGVANAQAQLRQANITLGDCFLRGPMDSVVIQRNVEVGTLAAAGTVGFVLGDVRTLLVAFSVPDTVVDRLRVGQPISVTVTSLPGTVLRGRVSSVSPSADPKTRVFQVQVTVANPDRKVKAGMIASVDLSGGHVTETRALVVPLTALVQSKKNPDGYAVFVVQESGGQSVARMREVEVGPALGNTMTLKSGVREGERIITSGAQMATDGAAVQIVK